MKILAVTNLYPNPFQLNRAPFNRQRFRILGARHPLRLIAPIPWIDERRALQKGSPALPRDRRVTLDNLTIDHPRYYYPPRIGRSWYGACYQYSIRKCFHRAVQDFRPDVVLATWAYPDGWAAGRLGHARGLPVVVQVHGSDVKLLDQYPSRYQRTVEALHAADGIIAVSQDLQKHMIGMGVPAGKIRVIYDGVDTTLFYPGSQQQARSQLNLPQDGVMLLFIGNLVPVKGLDILMKALGMMTTTEQKVRLVIVGSGPERQKLEIQANSLGLADRVQFAGALPQTELPTWYRAADVFVLPSRSEGVPNVLLEASACGIPWVASHVGGIPEILHRAQSARLVPPEDPQALASALDDLVSTPRNTSATLPPPRRREDAVDEIEDYLQSFVGTRS